ncbi:type II toxin-antitoxin system PemK/MazF family toxin [Kineococcus sp. SYSU DK004]|uniref:type II toxin-antitoxin system PemK/MazF family toxin n=1 Tax=Kineococcus sp. SYSU DK004 TaxID=3383125 RepID=UPI003D7CF1D3
MSGEVYRARFDGRGHEQRGVRYAVVLQTDRLPWLSTWVVAPTTGSDGPAPAVFRPDLVIDGETGRVLVEQLRAFDPQRLGDYVRNLTWEERQDVDRALRYVFDLD